LHSYGLQWTRAFLVGCLAFDISQVFADRPWVFVCRRGFLDEFSKPVKKPELEPPPKGVFPAGAIELKNGVDKAMV